MHPMGTNALLWHTYMRYGGAVWNSAEGSAVSAQGLEHMPVSMHTSNDQSAARVRACPLIYLCPSL